MAPRPFHGVKEPSDAPGRPVTAGELRAIKAYLEAGSTKAAATILGCSESTVKQHLWHVRSKLGVSTTAQAVFLLYDKLAA